MHQEFSKKEAIIQEAWSFTSLFTQLLYILETDVIENLLLVT